MDRGWGQVGVKKFFNVFVIRKKKLGNFLFDVPNNNNRNLIKTLYFSAKHPIATCICTYTCTTKLIFIHEEGKDRGHANLFHVFVHLLDV